ncbi:MAG: hypothetical protein AB7R55_18090 [Gemmatimonadales bacterium]
MTRSWLALAVACFAAAAVPRVVEAQARGAQHIQVPDSSKSQIVKLRDGSTLVGRFVEIDGDRLVFETAAGQLTLRRQDVVEVREVDAKSFRGGRYWHPDPNPTRLYFGPTARSLPKGAGDISNTYLFFMSGAYGVGNNLQVGGGFSLFPFEDFTDNVFFVTAKAGIEVNPNVRLAAGGLLGWAGTFDDDLGGRGDGLGAFYGVGTFGSDDHSVSTALLFPYYGGELSDPILMLGGEARIHRNLKLVTENYLPTKGEAEAILSYGLRIFTEKLSVGLALLNSTEGGVFPGVPYVDVVIRF